MPRTIVNQGSNGQYKTTVPKALAEALELDGATVEWKVKSGATMEVTKVE